LYVLKKNSNPFFKRLIIDQQSTIMLNKIFFLSLYFLVLFGPQHSFGQSSISDLEAEQEEKNLASEPWDRFSIGLGGFFASYNSGIRVRNQQLGLGLEIDIEDALGIDATEFAFRGDVVYKFGKTKKHSLEFGYFGIRRTADKILEEDLEIGDVTFPIGTDLSSVFNLSIIRLKYDYAIYQDSRVSIGTSFGLFIMPLNLRVKADDTQGHNTKFIAPLPLIGLRTDFKINQKLYLRQSVEFLYLSFATFSGQILDLNVYLEHKTFKNVALGFGVNSNRLNISLKNTSSAIEFFGDVRMDYTGLLLYGRYYF
jgi:hypothetical protein